MRQLGEWGAQHSGQHPSRVRKAGDPGMGGLAGVSGPNSGEEDVLGTATGDVESESGQGEEGVRTGSGVTAETA